MTPGLLKVGAALVMTAPFVPMLFQGEEWGASSPFCYFTDHADPELARAVAQGRRRGVAGAEGHDPQDPGTFARSKLDWGEIDDPAHRDLLDWHRALIGLRRETPELRDGRVDLVATRHDDDAGWLVLERAPMTIACNFSPAKATVDAAPGEIVLTSGEPAGTTLPPESVTIWRA